MLLVVVGVAAADTKVMYPYHLPLLTSSSIVQPLATGLTYTHQYAAVPVVRSVATPLHYSVPASSNIIPATQYAVPATQYAVPAAHYAIPAVSNVIPATQYSAPVASSSVYQRASILTPTFIKTDAEDDDSDDSDSLVATAYARLSDEDDVVASPYLAIESDHLDVDDDRK